MKSIAKRPLSRNLWAIMKEFKILPTNPDFQALTEMQVGFIMENMSIDAEYREMIAKGQNPDEHFKDSDDSWWETPIDEFDPKGVIDIPDEEIQKQIDAFTPEEDRAKLKDIYEGSKEWSEYMEEEGSDIREQTVEGVIQENLRKAMAEAKRLRGAGKSKQGQPSFTQEEKQAADKFEPMTQEGIEEAYKLFEGEEMFEEGNGPDDGWI